MSARTKTRERLITTLHVCLARPPESGRGAQEPGHSGPVGSCRGAVRTSVTQPWHERRGGSFVPSAWTGEWDEARGLSSGPRCPPVEGCGSRGMARPGPALHPCRPRTAIDSPVTGPGRGGSSTARSSTPICGSAHRPAATDRKAPALERRQVSWPSSVGSPAGSWQTAGSPHALPRTSVVSGSRPPGRHPTCSESRMLGGWLSRLDRRCDPRARRGAQAPAGSPMKRLCRFRMRPPRIVAAVWP